MSTSTVIPLGTVMETKTQQSKVTANLKKNRLIITLGGHVRKSELERIYTDIRFCVKDLQPGFQVLTDLRNCKIGYLSGALVFKKIMEFLIANGVGKIVRISGESRTIILQMRKLTGTITGYSPVYVSTPEEAEKALADEKQGDASD